MGSTMSTVSATGSRLKAAIRGNPAPPAAEQPEHEEEVAARGRARSASPAIAPSLIAALHPSDIFLQESPPSPKPAASCPPAPALRLNFGGSLRNSCADSARAGTASYDSLVPLVTGEFSDITQFYDIDVQEIGHGHYGFVRAGNNKLTGERVAIKTVPKHKVRARLAHVRCCWRHCCWRHLRLSRVPVLTLRAALRFATPRCCATRSR